MTVGVPLLIANASKEPGSAALAVIGDVQLLLVKPECRLRYPV